MYKLTGYIASDTFANRGNSHFADLEGNVACGSKARFGLDCHTEIRLISYDEFDTDMNVSFKVDRPLSDYIRRNHLPMEHFISCKKCQKYLRKYLDK